MRLDGRAKWALVVEGEEDRSQAPGTVKPMSSDGAVG